MVLIWRFERLSYRAAFSDIIVSLCRQVLHRSLAPHVVVTRTDRLRYADWIGEEGQLEGEVGFRTSIVISGTMKYVRYENDKCRSKGLGRPMSSSYVAVACPA